MKGSLSIQNVTLAYGKGDKRVLALDGISFEVEPNEFTVIVGVLAWAVVRLQHTSEEQAA